MDVRHQRLQLLARKLGFKPKRLPDAREIVPGEGVGFGADQREIRYKQIPPDQYGAGAVPAVDRLVHDLGHALVTPTGSTLRENQRAIGRPARIEDPTVPEREFYGQERLATAMEPGLLRRAGVREVREPDRYRFRMGDDVTPATDILDAVHDGRKTFLGRGSRPGLAVAGRSLDARINERARRGGGFNR